MKRASTLSSRNLAPEWQYAPSQGFFDEVLMTGEQVRPHWAEMAGALGSMGHSGMARRWQQGRRLVRDNGITYNVYGDPENTARPWPLDPIPFIISQEEWKTIEAAVIQRATLLNQILRDLYGTQTLLRDGLLPIELVFPNPSFLRPCWGIEPPEGVFLHSYAADLARSPDGQWWVLADRTQAPSGAGYALENRLVTTRVLPDVFRGSRVQRLARFFQSFRDALEKLAPANRENPRTVLLTPGPYNETYFEHAFLARYLGYTLVEGGDLTVRENRVYLKTLGGLLPVDAIVRRQDDAFCDPLELRPDSVLGVPGLLQAVRSGNVAIANALGSGLAESPAYAAFLPGLCRALLNEELKLPTVATWWCGQEAPLQYVADHLESLVVKPAFPAAWGGEPRGNPIFGAKLTNDQRRELIDRVRAEPYRWAAQEQVALSTAPVWEEDGKLQPRHLAVRVYAVSASGGYVAMPGGLTRVSSALDSLVVSIQSGGGSKDTWVLGDAPPSQFTLIKPPTHPLDVSRATFDLPSRAADNLFWLGRYVERLEAAVRTARSILARVFQEDSARAEGLNAGFAILSALGYLSATRTATAEAEVLTMLYSAEASHGLIAHVHNVRRLAWLLRDRISPDAWLILNELDQQFSSPSAVSELRTGAAQDLLNRAVLTLSAFGGMVMEGMTRGDGWRFLEIGRRLERALQMTELLRASVPTGDGASGGALEAVLEIADSAITYRSRYLTSLQTDLMLDLLLVDEANPRSIAFQLARLREHVDQLPASQQAIRRPQEARLALALLTAVQLADVRQLARRDGKLREALLGRLIADLGALSDRLTQAYFIHAARSRQLAAS
jgi:uncharacterized circularly permuted ATP-grasp superfamily protein/uncharacterized alpha-E superfamily protein